MIPAEGNRDSDAGDSFDVPTPHQQPQPSERREQAPIQEAQVQVATVGQEQANYESSSSIWYHGCCCYRDSGGHIEGYDGKRFCCSSEVLSRMRSNKYMSFVSLALLLSFAAFVVGVSILIASKRDRHYATIRPTPPVILDSLVMGDYWIALTDLVQSSSPIYGRDLISPNTAAWRAIEWMTMHDPLRLTFAVHLLAKDGEIESRYDLFQNATSSITNYSTTIVHEDRILQRFALVAMYFHWSGPYVWNFLRAGDGWPMDMSDYWQGEDDADGEYTVAPAVDECQWLAVQCDTISSSRPLDDTGAAMTRAPWPQVTALRMGGHESVDEDTSSASHSSMLSKVLQDSTIPAELGMLTALKHLDLSRQGLKGTFPEQAYSTLTNLVTLDLSRNALTEVGLTPRIQQLTALQYFDVGENLLQGEFPATAWGQIKYLKQFRMAQNTKVTGQFFQQQRQGQHKDQIVVATGTSKTKQPVTPWPALQVLDVSGCQLSGSLPADMGHVWTNLRRLDVSGTPWTGSVPSSIGLCTHLQYFSIGELKGTGVNGTIPTEIGYLSQLRFFNSQFIGLQGTIPTEFGMMKALEVLDLRGIDGSGKLPTELGQLTVLNEIAVAHIRELSGTIPTEIVHLSKLKKAKFHRTSLTGTMPAGLCDLHLKDLTADFCFANEQKQGSSVKPGAGASPEEGILCDCCTECYSY